jgi:hypothetical protein
VSRYQIELYSRLGTLIADISPYIKNLTYTIQRGQAEDLKFDLNLDAFEDIAAASGTHPLAMLGPYQTDVKFRRLNDSTDNYDYLFGTHIGTLNTTLNDQENVINVKAFGYLNLLIDRFVTKNYSGEDAMAIAWDLINTTQSQDNGDMGITQGPDQIAGFPMTRTYQHQSVKDGVLGLAVINGLDVVIDYQKKFNSYMMLGTDYSSELQFVYPSSNIKEIIVPRDALPPFNFIKGLGSGIGNETLESDQRDATSELLYGVHEEVPLYNSAADMTTLDQLALAELNLKKSVLEIPQFTVSGEDFDLRRYHVGDRIGVRIDQHPFLATVNGTYRIERLDVTVDDTEAETIKIYFDNYGLIL